MAILTQNDLDIYAEAYGVTPWENEGMTFVVWREEVLVGKGGLPKAFSLAAKKIAKPLSVVDHSMNLSQSALQYPTMAIMKYKKKLVAKKVDGVPLLSSYAVRTV